MGGRTVERTAVQRLAGTLRPLRLLLIAAIVVPIGLFVSAAWLNYRWSFDEANAELVRTTDAVHEHALKVFEINELVLERVAERYGERAAKAGRAIGIRGVTVSEIDESRARRTGDRLAEEASALRKIIPAQAAVIALHERGETLTSEALAQRIGRWRDQGRPDLMVLIGGPDGLAPELLAKADLRLAFGHMTWPHQLVRIMAFEQLYRAIAILSGHPYHRA